MPSDRWRPITACCAASTATASLSSTGEASPALRWLPAAPSCKSGELPGRDRWRACFPCLIAFTANACLPALDAGLPERRDHVVGSRLGNLDEGEALGDLDRADVPAGEVRLAGDHADKVLRPDSSGTAGPHEQTGRTPGRGTATALIASAPLPTIAALVRPPWQSPFRQ